MWVPLSNSISSDWPTIAKAKPISAVLTQISCWEKKIIGHSQSTVSLPKSFQRAKKSSWDGNARRALVHGLQWSWTEVGARVTSEQHQGQSSARLRDYQIDNLIPTTHGENRASKLAFDGGSLSRSD